MFRLLLQDFKKNRLSPQHGSIQKLSILLILAACFIVLVTFLAGFALARVKAKIQTDAGNALQIVLQTTQESLNLWVESNKFQLTRLAEDPRLISLVERLLSVPRNKDALLKSEALQEMRAFFQPRKSQFGQAGFFIISPDFVSIASMRDGNIGAKNLIANQALDLLNRAFQGETVMVPPIWSDVPLGSSSDGKFQNTPTMFFAAPVKNILASMMDITERKEAEKALRESRATDRGLLDATQESLLLMDKEGIIIAVNRTAARRHQQTPEELIGENRFDILPQNLRESRKAHFNNVLQTGHPADFEDVRDEMVFHHMYYPVQNKTGAVIGVAIFSQDITERKHMEEDLKRNVEELEQFSKLAFGREIKMIQLKKEINECLNKQGLEGKYEIVE